MVTAFLLTGSNLGDRALHLRTALQLIGEQAGQVKASSRLYETAPWGKTDQPAFINQAIHLETALEPEALLETLLIIERKMGRVRNERYGPRVIDIDILLYGERCLDTPLLTLPHPELHNRRFALLPLLELDADLVHPLLGTTMKTLLHQCKDEGAATPLD